MRTRLTLFLLICVCTGCTAGPSSGPDVTVTSPHVGRPAPPSSVQAALSRDPFTPYAALGQSNNDGLAPNTSNQALTIACLTIAGYPNGGSAPFAIRLGPANLAFSQPWGAWGYLGAAEAQQYGFRVPPGSALSALGIGTSGADANPASLPEAEQAAICKCTTIAQNFADAIQKGALAGIDTLSNDIYNDVAKDPSVNGATQAWATCMARNGYTFKQPQNVFFTEIQAMFGTRHSLSPGATVSGAANQAQIATAVSDANCSDVTDLAGIYFAVLASYEQQIVNANATALADAVRQFRAAYAAELRRLPGLLKTTSVQPYPSVKPGQPTSAAG